MKLKYYLRGLGIGIVVTAFIMSSVKETEKLTDAQIKLRALELGMVEETVLADLPQAAKEEEGEATSSPEERFEYTAGEADILEQENDISGFGEEIEESQASDNASDNKENEQIIETTPESTDKSGTTPKENETVTEAENLQQETTQTTQQINQAEIVESYIVISVEPGNGSETVSRRLYNAGLVESAVAFNRFLVDNGYDRSLVVGNHEIPQGASEEEMAKILCGLQ